LKLHFAKYETKQISNTIQQQVAKKKTLQEMLFSAVRRVILSKRKLSQEALVVPDKYARDAKNSGYFSNLWRYGIRKYLPRCPGYELRIASKKHGIGVFATSDIRNKVALKLFGEYGRQLKMHKRMCSDGTSIVVRRSRRSYRMIGSLALVNHACTYHANIVPFLVGNESNTMWRRATTTRTIERGEQLLVNYGDDCEYPCIVCGCVCN
jgi:hypothetical protein